MKAGIKARPNPASDNNCLSQSAIKNPRTPNQARLHSRTKWLIIDTLQPLISYYSDKLHPRTGEETKAGFMTLEPTAKDREHLKSVPARNEQFEFAYLTLMGRHKREIYDARLIWFSDAAGCAHGRPHFSDSEFRAEFFSFMKLSRILLQL